MLSVLYKSFCKDIYNKIVAIILCTYLISGKSEIDAIGIFSNIQVRNLLLPVLFVICSHEIVAQRVSILTFKNSVFFSLVSFISFHSLLILLLGEKTTKLHYLFDNLHLLLGLLAILIWLSTLHKLKMFLSGFIAFGFILVLLAFLGFNDPSNGLVTLSKNSTDLSWSPLSTPTSFYRIMFLAATSAAVLLLLSEKFYQKTFLILSIWLFIFGAFKSSSLAAVICFFVSLFIALVTPLSFGKIRVAIRVLILGIVIGTSSLYFSRDYVVYELNNNIASEVSNPEVSNPEVSNPEVSNPEVSNPEVSNPEVSNPEVSNPEVSNPEVSLRKITLNDRSQRIRMAFGAFKEFEQNPIYGSGWGNYLVKGVVDGEGKIGYYTYAHNLFLDFLSQSGLIGFTSLAFLLGFIFINLIRESVSDALKFPFFLFCVVILLGSMFGGDFYDFRLFFFVALIAMLDYKSEIKHTGSQHSVLSS